MKGAPTHTPRSPRSRGHELHVSGLFQCLQGGRDLRLAFIRSLQSGPGDASAGTHTSASSAREWLTTVTTATGTLTSSLSFQGSLLRRGDAASAADRAGGLLRGCGHTRRPAALLPAPLAGPLLGRGPGGPGGIGPDGEVIPAPLRGKRGVTQGCQGSRGRDHPSRRPDPPTRPEAESPPDSSRGSEPQPGQPPDPSPAHPDAVVPAQPLGLKGLHTRAVTHGSPAQAVASLDFVRDDPDLECRPAAGPAPGCRGTLGTVAGRPERAPRSPHVPDPSAGVQPPPRLPRPGPGAPRTHGARC